MGDLLAISLAALCGGITFGAWMKNYYAGMFAINTLIILAWIAKGVLQ